MGYSDLTSEFEYKSVIAWLNMDALAENDNFNYLPAGTKLVFFQSAAPTGWTKDTDNNDKALRVTSGTGGGTGGSTSLSSTITLAHTHTESHAHAVSDHSHGLSPVGVIATEVSTNSPIYAFESGTYDGYLGYDTSATGDDASHVDAHYQDKGAGSSGTSAPSLDSQLSDIAFTYYDCIICEKDAGTYTDLTTTFETKLRVDWQDFDTLADNDAYNHLEASTVMCFFQTSQPTNWTKNTTYNDKLARVVSGAGGGIGGSFTPSTTITLAHTHTVAAHTHTIAAHFHELDKDTQTTRTFGAGKYLIDYSGAFALGTPGSDPLDAFHDYSETQSEETSGAQSSATTDSQLTDIKLAYVDVIVCTKNASNYTDMTSVFAYKGLVDWSDSDTMADNDAYDGFEAGTDVLFFQNSTPSGWRKQTAQNDKAIRIVSGAGGGADGTATIAGGLTLAHAHTHTHSHSAPAAHTHDLATSSVGNLSETLPADDVWDLVVGRMYADNTPGSGSNAFNVTKDSTSVSSGALASEGENSDSQLTDTTLAYIDVIIAEKDT